MNSSERDIVKKLDVIGKLLYIQIKPRIEALKAELVKTEKHAKV